MGGSVWCGVVWCGVVLAEEVLPGCDYRVPGPLTMITRIAKSDNPALSSLCLKLPTRLVFPSWKLSAPTNLIFKWSQMEIWFVWWCLAERREESQWIMYSRLVLGARANYGSQPTSHPNSHSGGRELPRLPSALQISLSLLERRGGGLWGDGDCAGSDEMRWCNDAGSDLTTAQCLHDNFSEIWLPASPYYHWSRMSVDIIELVSSTQRYWYQMFTRLYSRLCQTNLDSQLLSGEHVRVVGPGERLLQFLQLEWGEGCPVSPLLPHLCDAVLVSHSDLWAGVQAWRPPGRSWPQHVSRVSAGVVVVPVLLRLPLELVLVLPRVREAHDVGDEEGLGAGLRPGDVCRGGDRQSSELSHRVGGTRRRRGPEIQSEWERETRRAGHWHSSLHSLTKVSVGSVRSGIFKPVYLIAVIMAPHSHNYSIVSIR